MSVRCHGNGAFNDLLMSFNHKAALEARTKTGATAAVVASEWNQPSTLMLLIKAKVGTGIPAVL